MKVLIIEDEQDLSKSISSYLSQNNYLCDFAYDFPRGREKAVSNTYDCIVLDISLPNGNGLDILKQIKKLNKPDGVLIISARISLDDKVTGLELGADDYLTKPFHLAELSSRINAIVRRRSFEGNNMLVLDKLMVNIADKSVRTENGPVELTRKEYELLLYFISNKNKVVTKESISDHLWGEESNMTDTYDFIYAHIKNLRKKLVGAGCPEYIKVVYGIGYKFSVSESKSAE